VTKKFVPYNYYIIEKLVILMNSVLLNGKKVGDGEPCYFIAEIGVSFKDFSEGKRLIDSAKKMGVDAVKFQTYEANTLTTKKNKFDLEITGKVSQYDFHKKYELSKELQKEIVDYAKKCGITIFSAPSHMNDIEIIEEMELPIYKIGSDLACHIPLLEKIARIGKPIILSTGMCTVDEIHNSVKAIKNQGNEQIVLMHCVADYPSKLEEANLNAIISMKKEFGIPVGYSDHTLGTITTLAGAIIGANIIERHFMDPKNMQSPDDPHSLQKEDFGNLIKSIKKIEIAKGSGLKVPSKSEQKNLLNNRVSIIAMTDIPKGTIIEKNMIDIRRPGRGIQPIFYNEIIGMKSKSRIFAEDPILWKDLEE
jgi:N,N'-diacetyllegionaminate synthase